MAALSLSIAVPALAQAGPGGGPMVDPWGDATVTKADADARAAEMFDRMDTNKDGVLSPEEMAAMRPNRPAGAPPAPAADAAPRPEGARGPGGMRRMLDANGDGKITKDEFIAAQGRRFARMDENGDGKVTKEERTNFYEDMRARMMMRGQGN